MSFLKNVFTKITDTDTKQWIVVEPKQLSIRDSESIYYSHLYPKTTETALTLPQKLVVDMVKTSLQKKEVRNKAVPRLPTVIPRLLRSLRDPESSARDYVDIIDKDPVMSATVLKLANSVYFNPIGARINDIERAVVKLGIDGLRSVLSAAVMQPIVQRESTYFSRTGQKMWHHSLSCAVACEQIAEHRQQEKFKVYVMGLVHDIGKITVFSELCKQFKLNEEDVKPGNNAFSPIMKVLAPAVSYWVAKDWDLPKDICKAIAEQLNLQPGNKLSPYGHILYQANMVTECHATIRHKNESLANSVLKELDLPENLYEKLDQLSREY
ncbi:HDOD domain-containing protein [Teredinibacter haidensis]|uniref:HDOD domain-containing protein n=1 Tax=Teredinibacter haidensis TaxID=2731755 RepID=UPI000948C040|nr:HDOD domain-containing protein [Teredinibacter haidensis]